jgi:hypothetical protein
VILPVLVARTLWATYYLISNYPELKIWQEIKLKLNFNFNSSAV